MRYTASRPRNRRIRASFETATASVLELCSLKGALAQLVARFHGMEEVRGSNPLCSTQSTRLEPLPMETLVEVRALFAVIGQNVCAGSADQSRGSVVVMGLKDNEVVPIDEIHKSVLIGDTPRPSTLRAEF